MITANKVISIFHYDGEAYTHVFTGRASVYQSLKSAPSGNGFIYDNTFKIRIPTTQDIAVSVNDYVYIGNTEVMPKKAECMKVISVGDNRRGGLKHWRIECK